ncbi:uncharacterized protein GGS22DRAFT_50237 [Annulohypoxylon maeteangense]|uniref:uncharacterized protein n=1 Tax=Annulohypoxylon maeteangense TaxID=1927788 RepID=UPI002007825C|nr:uncharacterized protein GGS22DRAFT_50237 [Annulohypoxylon maeteangense]KAI0882319.1 hypothetical protein GGS22DRAFT_50237 [Annulohypoxylon maeteangense]
MASVKVEPSEPTAAPSPSKETPHSHPRPQPHPQPQPQPQPQAQSKSQSQSQPHPQSQRRSSGASVKDFYGYLFHEDKSQTYVLDALLRAIGLYISAHIGDENVSALTPKKLAAFYRAVGGDYDQLFIHCPGKSISYIWQALGVEHTLQPTENPYEAPSIPALTIRGFVRWETIQILLEPQEHAPFIQFAVRNWALVNPDDGKPFPVDLPRDAFPAQCDPEIDAWHKNCAKKLRDEATPKDEHPPSRPPSDPRINSTYTHVRNPPSAGTGTGTSPRRRPEMDYFQRGRPVSYAHVPGSHYAAPAFTVNYAPGQRRVSTSNSSSGSPGSPPRRRSQSDVRHPEMEDPRTSSHLNPRRPPGPRRHSHSKPYSPDPSDSESEMPPRAGSKSRVHGPVPPSSFRRMPVAAPITPPIPVRVRRSEIRPDDVRRRSLPAEIRQKVTSFLSGSSDRHRSNSREKRHPPSVQSGVHFRRENSSRLSRSGSGDSYPSDESDTGIPPGYPARRERERERERVIRDRVIEKEQRRREREREEELERKGRHERAYLRPAAPRRSSSHTDVDRTRDYGWDRRDRDRSSDLDRDGRRVVTADEREIRDRRRYKDRGYSPAVTGVGGRRYPPEPTWKS